MPASKLTKATAGFVEANQGYRIALDVSTVKRCGTVNSLTDTSL